MNRKDSEFLKNKMKTSYELTERGKKTLITHYTAGHFEDFIFFDYGKGSKVYDKDGNEYIDCAMGLGPLILGHAHPDIVEAATKAIHEGSMHALGHVYEPKFAELIVQANPELELATFTNSGTEATMHAIKIARSYTGKHKIAKFEGHYHGTHEYAQISGRTAAYGPVEAPESVADYGGIPQFIVDNVITLSMNQPETFDILRKHKDELACVILEPLPWYFPLDYKEFLKELREVTKELNIVLIFDEIVTGFRLGYGGAYDYYGIAADLTTYGKVVGGGFPIGVIAGKRKYMKTLIYDGAPEKTKLHITGTFSGNPVVCAAGVATLTYLKNNKHVYAEMERRANFIMKEVEDYAKKIKFPLRMKGAASFFATYFFDKDVKKPRDISVMMNMLKFSEFRKQMLKNGVYLPEIGVGFLSTEHSDEDCEKIVAAFKKSLDELY